MPQGRGPCLVGPLSRGILLAARPLSTSPCCPCFFQFRTAWRGRPTGARRPVRTITTSRRPRWSVQTSPAGKPPAIRAASTAACSTALAAVRGPVANVAAAVSVSASLCQTAAAAAAAVAAAAAASTAGAAAAAAAASTAAAAAAAAAFLVEPHRAPLAPRHLR